MISLEIQNQQGTAINEVDLGNVNRGREANPQIIRLYNNGDSNVRGVRVWCSVSNYQLGTPAETYYAAYLSADGRLYSNMIYLNVDVDTFKEVYIKWRPPSTAGYGNKQWALYWNINPANTELVCD